MTKINPFVKWISSVDLLLIIMFLLGCKYFFLVQFVGHCKFIKFIAFDGIYVFKRVKLILKLLNFF